MKFLKSIYLTNLFFVLFGGIIFLQVMAFSFPNLEAVSFVLFYTLMALTTIDLIWILFLKEPIRFRRFYHQKLNLGDPNEVRISLQNKTKIALYIQLFEGYPEEMQWRKKPIQKWISAGQSYDDHYTFTPKKRGDFTFRVAVLKVRSLLHLWERNFEVSSPASFQVYPSVLQMKKYALTVFDHQKLNQGIKKIRKIGNNQEFEQIKNYTQGDEIRKINWKATSRKNELMVNQFQEEKSQNIYFLLEKGRTMQQESNELSMLDYAINSTLALGNITLKSGDKTGVITFSDKIGQTLPAEKRSGQLKRIMDLLYHQKTLFKEPNYDLLYQHLHRTIKTRSMLVLYSNFETLSAMRRVLPVLRLLNQKHVLIVTLFEHEELYRIAHRLPENNQDIYQSIIAENQLKTKEQIKNELVKNGIRTILVKPNQLTLATINQYLEVKAKGLL